MVCSFVSLCLCLPSGAPHTSSVLSASEPPRCSSFRPRLRSARLVSPVTSSGKRSGVPWCEIPLELTRRPERPSPSGGRNVSGSSEERRGFLLALREAGESWEVVRMRRRGLRVEGAAARETSGENMMSGHVLASAGQWVRELRQSWDLPGVRAMAESVDGQKVQSRKLDAVGNFVDESGSSTSKASRSGN